MAVAMAMQEAPKPYVRRRASRWASDAGVRGRNAPAGSTRVVARLLARLEARRLDLETYEAYYDGHQPLAFASQKFRDAFRLPLPGVQLQLHEPRRGRTR